MLAFFLLLLTGCEHGQSLVVVKSKRWRHFHRGIRDQMMTSMNSARGDTSSRTTTSAWTTHSKGRQEGREIMDSLILPEASYGDRIACGGDAQGLWMSQSGPGDESGRPRSAGGPVAADDPSTQFTYGEFPLESFDELLDLALTRVQESRIEMVDLGSGSGRLALYAALTRGGPSEESAPTPWVVHGIEISPLLHNLALQALQNGIDEYLFMSTPGGSKDETTVCLHNGPIEQHQEILSQCNLLFAYSTVFSSTGFSPELGAMVLDEKWSKTLSQSCGNGCVAITTDRALDPAHGWELVDRLDVENREVMGSTGYVHVLRK